MLFEVLLNPGCFPLRLIVLGSTTPETLEILHTLLNSFGRALAAAEFEVDLEGV